MSDSAVTRWEHFTEAVQLFLRDGSLDQAEEAIRGALAAAEETGSATRLARSLGHLAQLRFQQGNSEGCDDALGRALEHIERDAPAEAPLGPALNQLATLVMGRDPSRAEPYLERLLAAGERRLGAEHAALAIPLNNLARIHYKQGDFQRAEPLLRRLLDIKRRDSRDQVELAAVYASLGKLLVARRKLDEAEDCWRFALAIREQSLSAKDPAIAVALEGLAEVCEAQGKRAQGAQMRERALALREAVLGPGHARVSELRSRLAEPKPATSSSLEHLMYFPPKEEHRRETTPPGRPRTAVEPRPQRMPPPAVHTPSPSPRPAPPAGVRPPSSPRGSKWRRRGKSRGRRPARRVNRGRRLRHFALLGALLALCAYGGWILRGHFGPDVSMAWLVTSALAHTVEAAR